MVVVIVFVMLLVY